MKNSKKIFRQEFQLLLVIASPPTRLTDYYYYFVSISLQIFPSHQVTYCQRGHFVSLMVSRAAEVEEKVAKNSSSSSASWRHRAQFLTQSTTIFPAMDWRTCAEEEFIIVNPRSVGDDDGERQWYEMKKTGTQRRWRKNKTKNFLRVSIA